MPLYSRHCNACDELFDVQCKIAEKDLDHECPYCASTDGTWMLSAPAVSMRGDRFMTNKKDAGFSEVISKIAERNPRTKICERT
jgi:putative FmdB family regulatory protein